MSCSLCQSPDEIESEVHPLNCVIIKAKIGNKVDLESVNYEDIFSEDLQKQEVVTKAFSEILRTRKVLLSERTDKSS